MELCGDNSVGSGYSGESSVCDVSCSGDGSIGCDVVMTALF